jgi:hypothetical protein
MVRNGHRKCTLAPKLSNLLREDSPSNIAGSTGFCGQTLHPRMDPATSMFWRQLEWHGNPFSASKGEARLVLTDFVVLPVGAMFVFSR